MAFGKTILYQDFNSGGGNNRYFAEDINDFIMAMQGNYVISGCLASVGGETDLTASGTHVTVASGEAFVNGALRTISSANVDLSTAFDALDTDESRLILIYINSSGVVATISGDILTDGNQLPELSSTGWTPVDTTPIAWVYLTEADSTMDANQLRNNIVFSPSGGYIDGDFYVSGSIRNPFDNEGISTGIDDDWRFYHDGTYGRLDSLLSPIWIRSGDDILIDFEDQLVYRDRTDGNVVLYDFDVGDRTQTIGGVGDEIETTHHGGFTIVDNGETVNISDFLAVASANSQFKGASIQAIADVTIEEDGIHHHDISGSQNIGYQIPLDPNKGTLDLFIASITLFLSGTIDGSNFVDNIQIFNYGTDGNIADEENHTDNLTSAGNNIADITDTDFGNGVDLRMIITVQQAAGNNVQIQQVNVEYYYA